MSGHQRPARAPGLGTASEASRKVTPRQDMEAGVSVRAMVEKLEASSRITEGLGCASAQNLGSKRPAPPMLPAVLDKDELLCMELEKDKHESQEVLSEKRPDPTADAEAGDVTAGVAVACAATTVTTAAPVSVAAIAGTGITDATALVSAAPVAGTAAITDGPAPTSLTPVANTVLVAGPEPTAMMHQSSSGRSNTRRTWCPDGHKDVNVLDKRLFMKDQPQGDGLEAGRSAAASVAQVHGAIEQLSDGQRLGLVFNTTTPRPDEISGIKLSDFERLEESEQETILFRPRQATRRLNLLPRDELRGQPRQRRPYQGRQHGDGQVGPTAPIAGFLGPVGDIPNLSQLEMIYGSAPSADHDQAGWTRKQHRLEALRRLTGEDGTANMDDDVAKDGDEAATPARPAPIKIPKHTGSLSNGLSSKLSPTERELWNRVNKKPFEDVKAVPPPLALRKVTPAAGSHGAHKSPQSESPRDSTKMRLDFDLYRRYLAMTDEEAENLDVEKLVTYGGRVEKNAAASNWIYGNASTSGPRCDEKRPDKPVVLPLAPQTPTDSQQTSFETDQGTPDTPCPRTGSSTVPNFNTKELGISFKLTKGMTPTSEVMIPVTRLDSPEDVSPSDTQHAAKFSTRIKEHVSSTTRKLVNKTSSLNLRKAVATSSPSVDQAGPAHLQLGSGRTRAESGGTMKSRSSSGPSLPTPTPKLRLPKVDEYEAAKAKDLTSPIPLLSQMSARARARTLSDKVPTFDKWFGEDDMADKSRQEAQSPVETADNCHPSPTGSSLSLVSLTTFIRESRMSSMPDMKTGDAEATEQAEKKKGRAENLLKALVGKKKD